MTLLGNSFLRSGLWPSRMKTNKSCLNPPHGWPWYHTSHPTILEAQMLCCLAVGEHGAVKRWLSEIGIFFLLKKDQQILRDLFIYLDCFLLISVASKLLGAVWNWLDLSGPRFFHGVPGARVSNSMGRPPSPYDCLYLCRIYIIICKYIYIYICYSLWYHGAMLPCCHGIMVPRCHGIMVSWYHGTMLSCDHGQIHMICLTVM